MKKTTLLEKLGFTSKQNEVYINLIGHGKSSVSDIVRTSKLHRPDVYKALEVLIDKGLVYKVPQGKYTHYAPAPPTALEHTFNQMEEEFFNEVLEVRSLYETQGKRPLVTYREGKESITNTFSDMVHSLKKGDTYYRYSSRPDIKDIKGENFIPKDYREIRDKKQLERLVITNVPSKKKHRDLLGRSIKAIPPEYDLFDYDIAQLIYGNKVAILDYNSLSTITIENEKFAEFQKKIFKLLFKKL